MKESTSWLMVFALVITTGIIALLLELFIPNGVERILIDSYRLLSIFLGVLAGVALGEYFKIQNNQKAGNTLHRDLIEELRINHGLLKKDLPLRKGFWILGIRSGIARYLNDDIRRELWNIYSNITHYNDEFQRYHIATLEQGERLITPELEAEISNLRGLIGNLITKFFEEHSLEL